jgi:pentatricopeptide repeat protein
MRSGRIEDAVKVFDEMLAAGKVMPTAVMCNASSEAVEERATEGTALMQANHGPREGGDGSIAWRVGRRSGETKVAVIARRIQKEQLHG